jgi:hypothetical protein
MALFVHSSHRSVEADTHQCHFCILSHVLWFIHFYHLSYMLWAQQLLMCVRHIIRIWNIELVDLSSIIFIMPCRVPHFIIPITFDPPNPVIKVLVFSTLPTKSSGSGDMHFEHQLSMPTKCKSVSKCTSLSESDITANFITTEDIARNDIIICPFTADLFPLIAEFLSLVLILTYLRDGFPPFESIAHLAIFIILFPVQ